MRRHVVVLAAALAGCGYVGDPFPPALNIVRPVTDLRVVEFGDRLLAAFTIPETTTEDLPVRRIGEVELRIGPGVQPFDTARWAESAKKIAVTAEGPGAAQADLPARDWIGKEVVVAVRVLNARGRASDWSNLAIVNVVPPVPKVESLQAEPDPAGVRLRWSGAASKFRVYRRMPGVDEKMALLATPESPEYVDSAIEYGKRYEYEIQALSNNAESELSQAVGITPRDIFPPKPPTGLSGVAGIGSIELVWERNTESDLRGYRVYRATGNEDNKEFERIAEMVDAPAYSDKQIEPGKKYRYAVTAVDQAGNESPKSAAIEVTAP